MSSFLARLKVVGGYVFVVAFICSLAFVLYLFGDHVLERTIGRCNGGDTAQTCSEPIGIDPVVCTCDLGYHYFWQKDPSNK